LLPRGPFWLATKAESEAVRAIKEMFDRDFGKATQPVEGSLTYGISEQLSELFEENAGNTLGQEIARRAALPPPNGKKPVLTWMADRITGDRLKAGKRIARAASAMAGQSITRLTVHHHEKR
jgi:hypothetical protein